jgi:hypothetical protein
MNNIKPVVLLLVLFNSCSRDPYRPDSFLSQPEQLKLIRQTVYYSAKLPPNANHKTKFDNSFDWYYDRAAQEVRLDRYFINQSNVHYFLMTRMARSITPMREGIAGKIKLDEAGNITEYEEIFRTWKMADDSLKKRGNMLFERMVKGQDLTLYYSKFQGDRYIEFPDDRFYFDKNSRIWRDRSRDSIQLRP